MFELSIKGIDILTGKYQYMQLAINSAHHYSVFRDSTALFRDNVITHEAICIAMHRRSKKFEILRSIATHRYM